MKRFLCIFFCFLLTISMCSCKTKNTTTNIKSDNQTTSPNDNTTSNQTMSEESQTQSDIISNSDTDSIPEPETGSSQASSETQQTPSETKPQPEPDNDSKTPRTVKIELSKHTYIVNDADNINKLSTVSNGFSYGVAKDGVPHNQSITNQQKFDAFNNVDALALDTKSQEKVMYLTFDNGYEYNNLTADILDTLKEKNVKAAFFVTLSYVEQNPNLVQRMIDEGHIVGNHSTTHPVFPTISRTEMAKEIATLDNYLRENFSYTSPYFRFPTGAYSESSLELVTSLGFKSIFWSVAYADWNTSAQKGADVAFDTVTSRFHPGAVILLHAVSQDNADALGRIIDEAHTQGYIFKSLNDYSF